MSGTSITISSGDSSAGSSWIHLPPSTRSEYNDIEPSESASRSRQRSTSSRHVAEAPEVPSRRHSVARESEYSRPPAHRSRSSRHPQRSESRRVPSDESTSTLASHDDYPYTHGHVPPQHRYRYHHAALPGHGAAYPPSQVGGYAAADPFSAQDLVHMPRDSFGYPMGNGFSSGAPNPFAPMAPPPAPAAVAGAYHQQDAFAAAQQHRPMPQSRMSMYAAPPYGGDMYSMQQMMHPGYGMYPGMGYPAHPPSQPASPPPADDKNAKEFEALKEIIKKHEEERLAWEKAMIARAEAEAAAKAAEAARAEEEKKRKADIAAASTQAKEAAEKKAAEDAKKAADEADKKLAEAKKAQEEAEKKSKDLEEEKKKNAPAPDASKEPIRFKDAAHRKFSFPWAVCKTWKGMESLIRQAFAHIEVLGEHVLQGHYDLLGPDGEIILPQVWETTVQPGWEIEMVLWPVAELAQTMMTNGAHDPLGGETLEEILGQRALAKAAKAGKKGKKDKGKKATVVELPPAPPAHHFPGMPGGMMVGDSIAEIEALVPGLMLERPKVKSKGKSAKNDSALLRYMLGKPASKKKG